MLLYSDVITMMSLWCHHSQWIHISWGTCTCGGRSRDLYLTHRSSHYGTGHRSCCWGLSTTLHLL